MKPGGSSTGSSSARRLGGGAWSALVGFVALVWLTSSQITWTGDVAEPVAEPGVRRRHDDRSGVLEAAAAGGTATHRLRRRGWLLRRSLLLADVAAFACAVAVVEIAVVDFDVLSPASIGLGLAGLGAWVLVALGYG